VPYGGSELKSGKSYTWQVRVWDNSGKPSAWSAPSGFQMALLNEFDWKASWIVPAYHEDSVLRPSPMFRKEFSATKKIVSAVAYITAHGMYEAQINGKRVGEAYLTPGWTSYNKRLQYQVYNVTPLLTNGKNAIGVTLGSGWYRGSIGWETARNFYGKDIALLFQLNITYSDGSSELVVSDGSWKSSSSGPIRYSEIYNGEIYDARNGKNWLGSCGL
jgi:alpha-L-rhamnosidase